MGRDIIEIKKLLNKASKMGLTSSNEDDDKKNKPVKEDDIKKTENKK